MRIDSITISLAFCFLLSSCDDMGVVSLQRAEDDVQEAVFRHQFYENGSGYFHNGVVSETIRFFALAEADVDTPNWHPTNLRDLEESFARRFSGAQRPILKYSQVRIEVGGGVYDRTTAERGILFYVGPVRWLNESTAEAEGGYYLGGLNAEGDVFYLTRRGQAWEVDSVRARWVS